MAKRRVMFTFSSEVIEDGIAWAISKGVRVDPVNSETIGT